MGEIEHVRMERHVTYVAAVQVVEAALAKATELGVNAGVVVTDASGEIVTAGRTDGANARVWRGGFGKATAAVRLGTSTREFLEQRLTKDEVLWRAMSGNPDILLVPGGCPLLLDGRLVGAVGVSGGHYEDDDSVAKAGAARFAELVGVGEPGRG